MAKTRKQKEKVIEAYADKIKASNALIILSPTKITPNEANELRKKLKEQNSSFNVVKNTLFKVALDKAQKKIDSIDFGKENAIVFCTDDVSQSAKIISEFIKEVKKGEIKGGFLEDNSLSIDEIKELAQLPSKEVLIATTVRTIAAPISGFLNVLNGNVLNLINVLNNLTEQKESGE